MALDRNIAVDIGNSFIKSGDFIKNELIKTDKWSSLIELRDSKDANASWIFCSVRGNDHEIREVFEGRSFHLLTYRSKLPVEIDYKTPETLGMDRVAATIGAQVLFPGQNVLVIDMGTCITYDLLDAKGVFQGGIISPGIKMRMMAMHHFTKGLPDISSEWEAFEIQKLGKSTKECLSKGSVEAVAHEIDGFISSLREEFYDLVVLLTGGDAVNFESKLKQPIFARSNLVLVGLNEILKSQQWEE